MRVLLITGLLFLTGLLHAQSPIPFAFTSDDDNKLLKENDSVKLYKATDDTAHIVSINEETNYYRLLTRSRKVIAEGSFIAEGEHFLQDGKWAQYFDNGKLQLTGYYRKSKPVGTWQEFYQTGKLKTITNYGVILDKDGANSCLSGSYQEFYSNGKLKVNGFYGAERKKVTDTVEVEDPVSGSKVRKVVSQSTYIGVKTGTWEYYTEEGEFDKKEEH